MSLFKKVFYFIVLASMVTILFTGCDLLSDAFNMVLLPNNSISDSVNGKDLDLFILGAVYPEGIASSLESQEDTASKNSGSRNYFNPDTFEWSKTPDETYESSSGTHRVPETGSLNDDPLYKSRYFTMEKEGDNYKITFTKELPELSSLEKVVTVYYVKKDSWHQYADTECTEPYWESERVTYENGEIGDKKMIWSGSGTSAKGAVFISPDHTPFDDPLPLTGAAMFTIDVDRLYGTGTNHTLDEYFQKFWDTVPPGREGDYSAFSRTLVFDGDTAGGFDEDDDYGEYAKEAISEQNNYYTEVDVKSYPDILHIADSTAGRVQASINYYISPIRDDHGPGTTETEEDDKLEIVNAGCVYRDRSGMFLMKDVKSFEHAAEADYKYLYHHKELYYKGKTLTYHNDYYYYRQGDILPLRAAGMNNFDKRILMDISLRHGRWGGLVKYNSEVTEHKDITFKVQLVGDFLEYRTMINGVLYELIPDEEGNIDTKLPGGGRFVGKVSHTGVLSGTYTSAEGESDFCTIF